MFVVALAGCATSGPGDAPFVSIIPEVKKSVFPIVCAENAAKKGFALRSVAGSGFFVSPDGLFVTADHVLQAMERASAENPCPMASIYIPQGGWVTRGFEFRVDYFIFSVGQCVRDSALDVAVCRVPLEHFTRMRGQAPVPLYIDTSRQPDGTPVAFTGFPLNRRLPLTSIGTIAAYTYLKHDDRGPQVIFIDQAGWPGLSGSPIYLQNGKVTGVVTHAGSQQSSGLSI
jgi:S1-C subfamily serine protease